MLLIGEDHIEKALPQLRAQHPHVELGDGYDAQFYVQLAMQPNLHDPALQQALDNLPYRARRILLSWTAWAIGGGDPGRTLHVFATLNLVCWLALAVLLLRWFPANSWNNYLRWLGIMLSFGLCFSVRASLLDGPSLLAIAAGMALLESGRPWWAAFTLGAAGLIKETNILAATAFLPLGQKSRRPWGWGLLRGFLIALPCILWFLYLSHNFSSQAAQGVGNFSLPGQAFVQKWQMTLGELFRRGIGTPNDRSLLMMIALTTQALYLVLRPCLTHPWWRLGAVYLGLMFILGPAVWEGQPGAASRALLPLGLAFNVLLPRGRRWLLVLLLGNATIFCALQSFQFPGGKSFSFSGPSELRQPAATQAEWSVKFSSEWFPAKRSHWEYWRWSRGDAHLTVVNPLAQPIVADVSFAVKSRDTLTLKVSRGQVILWQGTTTPQLRTIQLNSLKLEPGEQVWSFTAVRPRDTTAPSLPNTETFCLRNLKIELLARAQPAVEPAPPPQSNPR